MSTVIKVENLSKQYRLGLVGSGTFKEDVGRWWAKLRGKEDPFFNVGEENDRTKFSESKFVWSLKDINFEVQQGDVLGIIGRNGAGKSTLLKILSKVTAPTTGTIKAKGRIASLLEVGTGFHPELTGRENIFLNGAILGMRKHEIKSKLDEIIAFAGVERYIDTPVKRYSSGMYVRLAFAVAAHLENEILIIDEVLAVGDAEFQKKCLGKMGEVSKNEGRTVLFVSHNIQAVTNLCTKGLLLSNGGIKLNAPIDEVVKSYFKMQNYSTLNTVSLDNRLSRTSCDVIFESFKCIQNNHENWEVDYDKQIQFDFTLLFRNTVDNVALYFQLKDPSLDLVVVNYKTLLEEKTYFKGDRISFSLTIPEKSIRPNQYAIYFALFDKEFKFSHDVIDDNVNLPLLTINPISMDVHENSGYFNLNVLIKKNDSSRKIQSN